MVDNISILFWANKARISQKTLKAPVYARVTINGKRAEISTGKYVEIKNWIANAGRVKGGSEEVRTINRFLDNINIKLYKIYEILKDEQGTVTSNDVKNRFLGKDTVRHSLCDLFSEHNEQVKNLIGKGYSEGTLKRYQVTFRHLKSYLQKVHNKEDIDVEDIKYSFILKFEYYLKTKKNVGHNATMKYLKNLKKIVTLARKYQWISHDPFIGFKITQLEVEKEFLTKEELAKLMTKDFILERLAQVRDVFIFCCFTGLSFSDVQKLTVKDIQIGLDGEEWIKINRQKTGTPSQIPLLHEAKTMIEKYKTEFGTDLNEKLFPVSSNQKTNAYLKEIGDLCGITKNMTFHMARHTFATTVTLSNGVSIETVSSMLGHKSIRTTQIYAKVVKEKVSREMNELKDKLQLL